ncbi:hypothetical protein CDAR_593281 [Caerostris darwini]|uniref:Secreted protein n=1 Tax=Caerostris darwini TaxID=1538125 RepID=A0AAV4RPC8_9ARAC|nr:hypothetical protein CDAR_593281 [Caerostris darwini]
MHNDETNIPTFVVVVGLVIVVTVADHGNQLKQTKNQEKAFLGEIETFCSQTEIRIERQRIREIPGNVLKIGIVCHRLEAQRFGNPRLPRTQGFMSFQMVGR